MIIRIVMFAAAIIIFGICALLMYADVNSRRKKIDKSMKKKKSEYEKKYQNYYNEWDKTCR